MNRDDRKQECVY